MLSQTYVRGLNRRVCQLRLWLSALALCFVINGSAQAYDLSRSYDSNADEVEHVFIVGSAALWMPEVGDWGRYHQLSMDFGGELGFRFASIQGAHNLYVVGGLNISPQMLDPDALPRRSARAANVIFGYGGVRYINGFLCFGDGMGCPFFELRVGLVFETNEADSIHQGPNGAFTLVPGVGYRFSFGRAFQLGGRLDISYSEENDVHDLGWLTATAFAGIGW